ncbi:MAG: hypothetical protein K2Q03_02850 [Sphingobacteriaceae bacterium]|nr:hypothetical protein [Sphingobacteriaceae bacterium]
MKKVLSFIAISLLSYHISVAQRNVTTKEDSLNNNAIKTKTTVLTGYGEAHLQRDNYLKEGKINLTRFTIFIGHQFDKNISFFSETEIENGKVSGGSSGGEISLEQAYLKFKTSRNTYLVAGLFLPRLGILNEDHMAMNFLGSERNMVETKIIPSTWREIGVGFYGQVPNTFFSYSLGVVSGLNSREINYREGIRSARFDGQNATVNNLAFVGSLRYNNENLRVQLSGYSGGSTGISPLRADSLGLDSGPLGSPVHVGIIDGVYRKAGFSAKALATIVSIPDAIKIHQAYAQHPPKGMYGAYLELGYNLLENSRFKEKQLILFGRYETLDMNWDMYKVNGESVKEGSLKQQHAIFGLNYLPIKNVVVKFDMRYQMTGDINMYYNQNLSPAALPYARNRSITNLAIGYAF